VTSVIEALGTEEIRRVKIGIGRPEHRHHVPDHVLTRFEAEEEPVVETAVAAAADRVLEILGRRG
jgi:PTH1 family peptidyl-tRNA hydrolase